jgi:signal transduction histidine kinase
MADNAPLGNEERERLKAQTAEIAALAGGLAHEIKNPLSTISLNLELMAEELDESPEMSQRDRRFLQKINTLQRECRNLNQILEAFLQFARLGELKCKPRDLNVLVREFISFYQPQAEDHGIEISPHLAADLPMVEVDDALIRQVLLNLALNAQQAMPDGGLLELQTYPTAGGVCLELIDNGQGMDERTRSRMFQAFFSTRSNGNGLGLPTVKRIVEAHHGTISCESEPGRGTRFIITLPMAPDPLDAEY